MAKINIGVIGTGRITRKAHLPALQSLGEEVNVLALADIKGTQELSKELKIRYVFEDYTQLLKLNEIDAVVISVPNYLHCKITVDALEAGKHVLCEKPLTINEQEALEIAKAQQRTGKQLMIAFNNRFRKDVQLIKKYHEAGELGEIYYVKCAWMRRAGIPGWGGWFTDIAKSGGGALIDLGVHMLDLALYIMGYPHPVSVTGSTYNIYGEIEKGQSRVRAIENLQGHFNVEDTGLAFIKFDNGSTLILETSWASNIEQDHFSISFLGSKGGAVLENNRLAICKEAFGVQHNILPLITVDESQVRMDLWKHFLQRIRTQETNAPSINEGVILSRIMDAIYQSARTGQQVNV
ncbi:MAG TPA: Gfo/Idh/MocA family oxidoreductase [Bacillota bacterium]|nr:Gfo/Idh/MocA family oxidoreductase [Bacillota bacterium]